MFNPHVYITFVCFVSWHLSLARAECLITHPDDKKLMPSYTRPKAGDIRIPYNSLHPIQVEDDEVIDVFCLTGFRPFRVTLNPSMSIYFKDPVYQNISLVCRNGELLWTKYEQKLSENKLSCKPWKWSLFHSNESKRCAPHEISYTMGSTFWQYIVILANLCYDATNYIPRLLNYYIGPNTFPKDHNDYPILQPRFHRMLNKTSGVLESKIFQMTHLSNKHLEEAISSRVSHNHWLQLANYELHSLVQGKIYQAYLHEYKGFLDIPWWKNLRRGNWRRVMEALDEQATSKAFNVTTGISGVAPVPHEGCSKTRDLHVIVEGVNVTVPEYVWSYIEPVGSDLDSFVVIGYNSPYFEFFPRDTTMLCQDICHTIDWLTDVRSTFKKTTAGIVFCCDAEEIREDHLLKDFPRARDENIKDNEVEILK